jgi:hypothetical protein
MCLRRFPVCAWALMSTDHVTCITAEFFCSQQYICRPWYGPVDLVVLGRARKPSPLEKFRKYTKFRRKKSRLYPFLFYFRNILDKLYPPCHGLTAICKGGDDLFTILFLQTEIYSKNSITSLATSSTN